MTGSPTDRCLGTRRCWSTRGLVPIPLFINAPDPQGAFAATLPLVEYVEFIYTGRQGKLQPRL